MNKIKETEFRGKMILHGFVIEYYCIDKINAVDLLNAITNVSLSLLIDLDYTLKMIESYEESENIVFNYDDDHKKFTLFDKLFSDEPKIYIDFEGLPELKDFQVNIENNQK